MRDGLADIKDLVEAGSLREYRAKVIEECARVAEFKREQFFNHTVDMANAIAAAIRALKT